MLVLLLQLHHAALLKVTRLGGHILLTMWHFGFEALTQVWRVRQASLLNVEMRVGLNHTAGASLLWCKINIRQIRYLTIIYLSKILFMLLPIRQIGPEAICFRFVRPSARVRARVRARRGRFPTSLQTTFSYQLTLTCLFMSNWRSLILQTASVFARNQSTSHFWRSCTAIHREMVSLVSVWH